MGAETLNMEQQRGRDQICNGDEVSESIYGVT